MCQCRNSLEIMAQLIEHVLPGSSLVGDVAVQDAQRDRFGPAAAVFDVADDGCGSAVAGLLAEDDDRFPGRD